MFIVEGFAPNNNSTIVNIPARTRKSYVLKFTRRCAISSCVPLQQPLAGTNQMLRWVHGRLWLVRASGCCERTCDPSRGTKGSIVSCGLHEHAATGCNWIELLKFRIPILVNLINYNIMTYSYHVIVWTEIIILLTLSFQCYLYNINFNYLVIGCALF